jgi:hypothetical protein
MKSQDAEGWKLAVDDEHKRMVKNGVWTPVPKLDVANEAKILSSTWAMECELLLPYLQFKCLVGGACLADAKTYGVHRRYCPTTVPSQGLYRCRIRCWMFRSPSWTPNFSACLLHFVATPNICGPFICPRNACMGEDPLCWHYHSS